MLFMLCFVEPDCHCWTRRILVAWSLVRASRCAEQGVGDVVLISSERSALLSDISDKYLSAWLKDPPACSFNQADRYLSEVSLESADPERAGTQRSREWQLTR